jgi:hypothetical protein
LNLADIASRGMKPSETATVELWEHGADFLSKDKKFWPEEPPGLVQLPDYYDHLKAQMDSAQCTKDNSCSLAAAALKELEAGSSSHASVSWGNSSNSPIRALLSHFSEWLHLCKSVAWLIRLQRMFRQKLARKP